MTAHMAKQKTRSTRSRPIHSLTMLAVTVARAAARSRPKYHEIHPVKIDEMPHHVGRDSSLALHRESEVAAHVALAGGHERLVEHLDARRLLRRRSPQEQQAPQEHHSGPAPWAAETNEAARSTHWPRFF